MKADNFNYQYFDYACVIKIRTETKVSRYGIFRLRVEMTLAVILSSIKDEVKELSVGKICRNSDRRDTKLSTYMSRKQPRKSNIYTTDSSYATFFLMGHKILNDLL